MNIVQASLLYHVTCSQVQCVVFGIFKEERVTPSVFFQIAMSFTPPPPQIASELRGPAHIEPQPPAYFGNKAVFTVTATRSHTKSMGRCKFMLC